MTKEEFFKVIDSPNKNDWSKFVYKHPHNNIFQTPEMAEVYKRTKKYEPISLAVVNDADEILAVLQAVVIREMEGILGSFSVRSIIQGGPLFIENERGVKAVSLLMGGYNKVVEKSALYSEIRNTHDTSRFNSLFKKFGYDFEDHLNFLVDLNKSKEEVWKQINRSMRKNIKRAQRKGVTIEEIEEKFLIRTFYNFLNDVYHNVKVPLADISLFESVFDILVPKGMAKFHFAKYNGEYIGGRLSLMYKNVIYAYSVGVPGKHKDLYPSPLLNWHVIEWGSKNGYHTFDFGGAGKPNEEYGVREFKKQFGGKKVNFGRYKKIHSPRKLWLAEKGFEVWRRLK